MERVHGSPELQLLVASAHPSLRPEAAARVRALASTRVDWSSMLHLAGKHGVRSLLYRSLSAACPESVPAAVLEELLTFVRSDTAHNLSQNVELVGLLEGLSERGIPAIPFKGGVLADWAYADSSLRESGDIDIIVRRRHLRETIAFLLTREYRPRVSGPQQNVESTNDPHVGGCLRLDRIDGLASVDLQTSLEAPHFSFELDNDELWDRVVRRMFVGHSVLSYCAEDLFILLCVHGTKDVWFKVKWICDIAAFIECEPGLNWEQVLVRATNLRARRKLLLGCWLAHDLLGADVPEAMLTQIRREPSVLAAASSVAEMFARLDRKCTGFERAALYFKTADPGERTRSALRYVRRSLNVLLRPTENDRKWVSLPEWLSPVYYLVRPIRLIKRFAQSRVAAKAIREMFESLD